MFATLHRFATKKIELESCCAAIMRPLVSKTYYTIGPSQGLKSGGFVVLGGENVSPLVEIGLTDLLKTGEGGLEPTQPYRL